MSAETIGAIMTPILKKHGYKKRNLTWFQHFNEITVVFNIQRSQFSKDVWYYNFGIGLNHLFEKEITGIYQCDITYRFDQTLEGKTLRAKDLEMILIKWVDKYGSISRLKALAYEGKLPQTTTIKAKNYLMNWQNPGDFI